MKRALKKVGFKNTVFFGQRPENEIHENQFEIFDEGEWFITAKRKGRDDAEFVNVPKDNIAGFIWAEEKATSKAK